MIEGSPSADGRSDHRRCAFLGSLWEFCVARRGRARHPRAATENRACQRFVGAPLAVVPGCRDVEIAAVVAAKRHRGRIRRRQLDHAVEGAVGAVAVDRPRSSQGDPQHALIVDGHAVRPELFPAEIEEPPATGKGTRRNVQVEGVDYAQGRVGEVEPPARLIEGGPVGDRQPVDHTGHPAAVDAVQSRVARPLVEGHRADPDPSPAVDLDVVGAVLGPVALDRNPQIQCACAAV